MEAYVERIARDDEQAEQELEALALEGLNSGESIEADEKYCELSAINRLIVTEEDGPVERRYSFPVGIFLGR